MSGHTYTHTYIHTHTHTHTYTHDNYSNPRCAHAHRGLIIVRVRGVQCSAKPSRSNARRMVFVREFYTLFDDRYACYFLRVGARLV